MHACKYACTHACMYVSMHVCMQVCLQMRRKSLLEQPLPEFVPRFKAGVRVKSEESAAKLTVIPKVVFVPPDMHVRAYVRMHACMFCSRTVQQPSCH